MRTLAAATSQAIARHDLSRGHFLMAEAKLGRLRFLPQARNWFG
jgi:hypothetical protein